MGRIDVVRIIARLNVGGPALHVLGLSTGLEGRYRTLLVTGRVAPGEEEVAVSGVRRVVIPELGRAIRPWSDVVAFVKLVRLLRRVRPKIVHTHTAKAGALGRLAAVFAGVPVRVHTFHGHVFRGYFSPGRSRIFIEIERLLARLTTCIIAVSPGQAEELSRRYRICARERIRVVPLGLELERFRPERNREAGEAFRREIGAGRSAVVTIVGRLEPIKNHDMFLAVAAALVREGRDVVFAVVGGGSEEARLRRVAEGVGIGGRVRFLGWRTDVERVYAGSDVVVLTSRNEGTPVSVIEALSSGRAVVATDAGGVREVLQDGRLGVIVGVDDVAAMAAAVGDLLDHPEARERLGSAGAAVAPVRYSARRLLDEVGELYDELLHPARTVVLGQRT